MDKKLLELKKKLTKEEKISLLRKGIEAVKEMDRILEASLQKKNNGKQ